MTEAPAKFGKVSPMVPAALMLIFLYVGILSMQMSEGKGRARRSRCMSNLSSLGKYTAMYTIDNQDKHPALWSDVAKEDYVSKPLYFICPSSGNNPGKLSEVDQWSDYVLIDLSSNSLPTSVQAYCPPANHEEKGGLVLCLDGSVTWLSKEKFNQLIKSE